MPPAERSVIRSPKTVIPKKMAVSGSNAPRMAVGVEPIYWMARVVATNDTQVGSSASAATQSQCSGSLGSCSPPADGSLTAKSDNPNSST